MNAIKKLVLICPLLMASATVSAQFCPTCPDDTKTDVWLPFAGIPDNFRLPVDPTYRRLELDQLFPNWVDFDEVGPGPLGHSFTLLPCLIRSARLYIHAEPINTNATDDTLSIGLEGGSWRYVERFSTLTGRPWTGGGSSLISIDLLGLGLGDHLADHRYLDILVNGETRVDYMRLNVVFCNFEDCNGNCQADHVDIDLGFSTDFDENGIPDECDPGLLCPETRILEAGSNCCRLTTLAAEPVNMEGPYSLTNNYDPGQQGTLTACFPVGTTTVVFTLTYGNGQTKSCAVTVIVTDSQGPSITPAQE